MFFEILFFIFLGITFGLVTGLIPGLHPNTVFMLLLSIGPFLFSLPLNCALAFIISLGISNSFFDFIPAIFFGAPEEGSVLSVLPGHRMLLLGRGEEALLLTVVGGVCVVVLTILSFPFLLHFLPFVYESMRPLMHVFLVILVVWMVMMERGKKRIYAAIVFVFSGLFGILTLTSLPSDQALFPALTGLFGLSTLLTSMVKKTKLPPQKSPGEIKGDWLKGGMTGWLAGMLAGLLPGVGSSQAGVIAAQLLRAKLKEFLIALGGINTSNILFTFIAFYTIGKTRSGAAWAVSQITDVLLPSDIIFMIIVAFLTCFFSGVLTLKIGKLILNRMKHVNYRKVMVFTIVTLFILVFIFSGESGILISLVGVSVGVLTISFGVKRTHMMGFLLLPTILYFSGASPFVLSVLF